MGFFCTSGQPQQPPLTCKSTTKKVPKLVNDTVKRLGRQADAFMRTTIPSCSLDLVYVSSCAVIFRGLDTNEKPVICKVFHGSSKSHQLGKIELQAYNRLADAGVTDGVPQLHTYYDNGRTMILVMQDLVMDAYDFVCGEHDSHLVWMKGIRDLVGLINEMHSKDIIHGDIKLENMAYDYSKWYLLDFAFSKLEPGACLTGTIPYLPPRVTSLNASQMTKRLRMEFDYYAFALAMLTMFDLPMYEKCSICLDQPQRCKKNGCCSRTYVITEIDTLYTNSLQGTPDVPACKYGRYNQLMFTDYPMMVPIYKVLCNLLLCEMDTSARFLVWDLRASTRQYEGSNIFWSEDAPKFETPDVYWKQLTELCVQLTSI